MSNNNNQVTIQTLIKALEDVREYGCTDFLVNSGFGPSFKGFNRNACSDELVGGRAIKYKLPWVYKNIHEELKARAYKSLVPEFYESYHAITSTLEAFPTEAPDSATLLQLKDFVKSF